MSKKNVWDDVDISNDYNSATLIIKKNITSFAKSSLFGRYEDWINLLSFFAVFVGLISLFMAVHEQEDITEFPFISVFIVVYCAVYGYTLGKIKFTGGDAEEFMQYTRAYFFAGLLFGLGVLYFYEKSSWFWLSFIFFGLGVLSFCKARFHWSEYKELVYELNWRGLGGGYKFLIIQNNGAVKLYELKDELDASEYNKIVKLKQEGLSITDQLCDDEIKILRHLARRGQKQRTAVMIAASLNLDLVTTEGYLEQMKRKEYVDFVDFTKINRPLKYHLTQKGREYLQKNNLL